MGTASAPEPYEGIDNFVVERGGLTEADVGFLEIAIAEAYAAVESGEGGPFGAVVVRDGEIVVRAHNQVLRDTDPTAHAETTAVRKASAVLGRHDLSDCVMYASCEPCPMCFGAIHLAKMKRLVYGAEAEAALAIGFDDFIADAVRGTAQYQRGSCAIHQAEGALAEKACKVFTDAASKFRMY